MSEAANTPTSPVEDASLGSVSDLLDFYARRGYGHIVGLGKHPCILVIDYSVAFTVGTADFPTGSYKKEIEATVCLLEAARGKVPVLFTTIAYDHDMQDAGLWAVKIPWLAALKEGTEAVDIDPRLSRRADETVIVKKYPSSFHETELGPILKARSIDTLIIAGCTTSVCVRATAVDSMQHGYRTILAADCIGDLNPALHRIHLTDLEARYADLASLTDLEAYFSRLDPN